MTGRMTISNAPRSHEEELRDRLRLAARRDGGDPSSFLELLVTATDERIWERFEPPRSFVEFVEAPIPDGLGLDAATLERLISFQHHHEDKNPALAKDLTGMRRFVSDELAPKLARHGAAGNGRRVDNIKSTSGGTGETYIVRRLKRDRPDLAELVLDGKVSARAAGIAAGFVKRTATVPIDDPERLAAALRRRLDPTTLQRLLELLVLNRSEGG
jgi:hypothetical protein